MGLVSDTEVIEVDDDPAAFFSFALGRGWTDGLPVIPPTRERVDAMLTGAPVSGQETVAVLDPRHVAVTAEKVAINAVMAGCLPEHMSTLVAAVRAIGVPDFNLHGIQGTTNPVAPLAIVNGPERIRIGVNCGRNALGQGSRANATIGRAIRLVMQNAGGGIPGETDKAIHGMPAKFSFCLGELEEDSPWEPLHVERGFDADASTVTVVGACSLTNSVLNLRSERMDPEINLGTIADAMAQKGANNVQLGGGNPLFVLPPRFAQILDEFGWTKAQVKQFLWQHGSIAESDHPPEARIPMGHPRIVDGRIHPCEAPDDIILVVAGGPEPYHVMYMANFGETVAETVAIERPVTR